MQLWATETPGSTPRPADAVTCRAASFRWCLLLVHYPGHASHRVAADPDVVINLADVDPATPADDGSASDRAQCPQAGPITDDVMVI